MAALHPSLQTVGPLNAGAYRERDVLFALEQGLPPDWDIFHNVDWAAVHNGRPQIGEVDIAVVSPGGFLLLVEVKAGRIEEDARGLAKRYGETGEVKDIGAQLRRNHSALLSRLRDAGLREVRLGTLLVLPDHRLTAPVLAHAPETIVDAASYPELGRRVQQLATWQAADAGTRERLLDFLANRFHVVADVSSYIGQVQRASRALAAGLATWVPQVQHPSGLYVLHATAGSGKTQLALALMRQAREGKQRCAYVCFNRPLADHMASLAPATAQVCTFHELAVEHARRQGTEPRFDTPGVHDALAAAFVADAGTMAPRWDLLILDEHQDFEPAWAGALLGLLAPDGRGYVMGDARQQLYGREEFALQDAVTIRCMDNFRSPRKVVEAMNRLRLTEEPVVARSAFAGEMPGFHDYLPGKGLEAVETCIRQLLAEGVPAAQMVVLTFAGIQHSTVFGAGKLAGLTTRKFRGSYDAAGNPLWTDGELLVETVYRFKGQSAPVIVLCEIDFEALETKQLCKLFVGMTRAQFRLKCVLAERAAAMRMERAV